MPRPQFYTFTPSDPSLTGFASNVTGGTWVLTSTTVPDGLAHQVSLRNDSTTNHSAKTTTFVGTDANDHAISETINMPGASATVETTYYFKTLTSVTPSATIGADTMDIGYVDEFASQLYGLDWRAGNVALGLVPTGTINGTVQHTFDDIQNPNTPVPYNWFNHDDPTLVGFTTNVDGNYIAIPYATRVIANSYSNGATLKFDIFQQNNG